MCVDIILLCLPNIPKRVEEESYYYVSGGNWARENLRQTYLIFYDWPPCVYFFSLDLAYFYSKANSSTGILDVDCIALSLCVFQWTAHWGSISRGKETEIDHFQDLPLSTRLLKWFLALESLSFIPSHVSGSDFRKVKSDLLAENAGICTFLVMYYVF